MLSVLAGWRVSLRRTRADWPIVLAAWLTMLLATTLLAAGPIYSSAVSVAGLRQLLAEASIEAGNVRVSAGAPLDQVETVDKAISGELHAVAGTLPAELARFGTADSFALPGHDQGITAIMATHDPSLIDLADQVIELRDGQIVPAGA